MKKIFRALFYVVLSVAWSQASLASPILAPGTTNQLSFNLAQNLVDVDGSGGASSGDILYGIFNVTRISAHGSTIWNANNVPGPGIDSLSGYYLFSINAATPLPAPWAGAFSMGAASFDPNGVFTASDIAAHTIVKLFADTSTPFDTSGTVASGIAKATDGTLWASLGIDGGYWDALAFRSGLIQAGGGLNLVANNTGMQFGKQSNPSCASCALTDLIADTVSTDNGLTATWRYTGGNNASFATLPEPAMNLLFLIGVTTLLISRFTIIRRLPYQVPKRFQKAQG